MSKSKMLIQFNKFVFSIVFILISIYGVTVIVYRAGGTEYVFTHLMYIPIILAVFLFDVKGGVAAAIAGGLALGPFMPLNVADGTMQEPRSWILRAFFFASMGLVMGFLSHYNKKSHENQIRQSYEHYITGYPNINKLRLDMNDMIWAQTEFSLIIIKIVNLSYIKRYVDEITEEKAVFRVLDIMGEYFQKENIYCISINTFVITMCRTCIGDARERTEKFLENFIEPIKVDHLSADLVLRCGIAGFPAHGGEVNDLIRKLQRTLDQDQMEGVKISVYENSYAEQNRENYEKMVALYDAMKNNEMKIEYQPIIDIKKNRVTGVEALVRWNSRKWGMLGPDDFIGLAEYTGFITDITKWAIEHTVCQLREWREGGIAIKAAVNISSKDLKDDDIIWYAQKCLEKYEIEPEMLEFELTERTISDNEELAEFLLQKMSQLGIKISIDDFGTGYNSLVYIVKLPIDYVKLDKYFIRRINDSKNRPLVDGVIKIMHTLGKEIIAEGVETQEQAEILKQMECDNIQGYYYCKPLPPQEIKKFITGFSLILSDGNDNIEEKDRLA